MPTPEQTSNEHMGMSILYPLLCFILRGERGQLLGPRAPWGPRVGFRGPGNPGNPQGTPRGWVPGVPGTPGTPRESQGIGCLLGSTQPFIGSLEASNPLVGWKHATIGWLEARNPLVGWKLAALWLVGIKQATIGWVEKVDPVSLVP